MTWSEAGWNMLAGVWSGAVWLMLGIASGLLDAVRWGAAWAALWCALDIYRHRSHR